MPARIYVIPISNPSAAGTAMLRHKRIPHRVVTLMPGLHPLLVRVAGFERHTVPALELDGRKAQGSREMARVLDQLVPDPPLLPRDPEARRAVEEAERWGVRMLQPLPRRLGPVRAGGGTGLRLRGAARVPRLGRADPARAAGPQLSEGSAGMVAISR